MKSASQGRVASILLWSCGFAAPGAVQGAEYEANDSELLRAQIEAMQQSLREMQRRLEELETRQDRDDAGALRAQPQSPEEDPRESEAEPEVAGKDEIKLGGAIRLNYAWRDYDDQNKDRVGDFELELFRANLDGSIGDVLLSAEWRRYNDFQAIHHAWIGYDLTPGLQLQLGISQVPFGILPFASHSFWFGGTYYLGYEDDYDSGIKFVHQPNDDWTFHYAFFKNPEYADDARFGRYSFDLVTRDLQQNTETNQVNLRGERHLRLSDELRADVGLSLHGGQVYNRTTEEDGSRWAAAVHMDAKYESWNFQLQGIRYQYNPENPDDFSGRFVQKGAFDFPFLMASRANVLSANIARALDVSWGPITGTTCYNDFTWIDPAVGGSAESVQNVTGCSVAAGGVFAYLDWISGKNMWFVGGDGIGLGGDSAGEWESRFNVNIGYYF